MKNKLKYILIGIMVFVCSANNVLADVNNNINVNINDEVIATTIDNVEIDDAMENPDCEALINKDLKELINKYMMIIGFIVPLLLIILCMIDFSKAVVSYKEDEMRKLKNTAIKRLIMGILVFFVPTIVNFVLWFADEYIGDELNISIYEDANCGLE